MSRSRKGSAALAAVLIAIAAAIAFNDWRKSAPEPSALVEARLVALNAQLAQVAGPYALLVGDSHAERLFLPTLCGRPVVDAGLGGLRTVGVRQMAERLVLPRPPDAVVVMTGTNDLARRRDPASASAREAFRGDLRTLLGDLAGRARKVYATPLPPLDEARAGQGFDTGQVGRYSAILAEECVRAGCVLADVFPSAAGRSPDGVHVAAEEMTAPDGVVARLERIVCAR